MIVEATLETTRETTHETTQPIPLIRPRPLRDQVYDRLRAMILSGEIAPGSPVIELDIAARFGASRTPIREALRRLEAEGMLEPRGARGTIVRALKSEEVFCILEIREALEKIAALRASRRMQPNEFTRLESLVEQMRHSVDDLSEMERLDTAFHDEILAHAEGIRLKRMLGDLRSDILPLRPFALATLERRQAVVNEHASMLDAIRSHDEDAITQATHLHIVNTRTAILQGSKLT